MTSIRQATSEDTDRIRGLLSRIGLGGDDLLASGSRYWLAEVDGQTVGVIGLEQGGTSSGAVLLRSAAVRAEARGQGLGARLVHTALAAAAGEGCTRAYLFSTDAGPYWESRGFHEVPVAEIVATLPDAPQVVRYDRMGWLPTEVAWRRDLDCEPAVRASDPGVDR